MDFAQMFADTAAAVAGAESIEPTRVSGGYSWTEIPRWYDGALYFSDMYNHRILRLEEDGTSSVYIDASDRSPLAPEPGSSETGTTEVVLGGLGWLPDGRAIVVSMHERIVLVWDGTTLDTYADLRDVATSPCNDMVVDADGRAYITQLGYNIFLAEEPLEAALMVVEPDGTVRNEAGVGLFKGANGIAISADGETLITAENDGVVITAMDRAADGSLSNRREFARPPWMPDGICLDDGGGVWAGMPGCGYVGRFVEGGEMTHAVGLPVEEAMGTAVALGGAERTTLYIAAGLEVFDWEKSREDALGSIWTVPAPFSGGTARP